MGAVLGLVLGLGLLLILRALTTAPVSWSDWRRESSSRHRVAGLLRAAGIENVTPAGLVSLCALAGVLAFMIVLGVSRTPPVALVFAAMAAYAPVALVRARVRRRRRDLQEVWPEAVDNLASAIRAGLSLPEALAQLGRRGPEPLRPAFDAFGRDYQATGRFGACLDRLKERLSDPVGDRVVESAADRA